MDEIKILIVDDEKQTCADIKKALELLPEKWKLDKYVYSIETATMDTEALEKFKETQHDIVFMDILLEGSTPPDGIEVLKKMYKIKRSIGAIIITGNHYDFDHARKAMQFGGKDFLDKSCDNNDIRAATMRVADDIYADKEKNRLMNRLMNDKLEMYEGTVSALSQALNSRDSYTKYHSHNVSEIASLLSKTAFENGLLLTGGSLSENNAYLEKMRRAGILHDIGKIAIPSKILLKPDKLIDEEFSLMKIHPNEGISILTSIRLEDEEKDMIKYHHCWFCQPKNGNKKGYPPMDDGYELHPGTWIIGVADAFDAMTSKRSYKTDMSYLKPLEIIYSEHESVINPKIREEEGIQFHPHAIKTFFLCDGILNYIKRKHAKDKFGEKWEDIEKSFYEYRNKLSVM